MSPPPGAAPATAGSGGSGHAAVVLAAGAICWRPRGRGGLEVLLIHSVKYDDWSWPKGKPDRGETLPECAVREVGEETGVAIRLARPLPPSRYRLPDGRGKEVWYWAARQASEDGGAPGPLDEQEVDDVAWVSPAQARRRLSRTGDRAALNALTRHAGAGELDTSALLLLRHAEAQPRRAWSGSETDRPLAPSGRRQAQALVGLLACWGPELLLSSTWERCTATLAPYADAAGLAVAPKAGLTEAGYRRRPRKVRRHLDRLVAGGRCGLVCTHRPVLGGAMAALRGLVRQEISVPLPGQDPWLDTGELLVAHGLATDAGRHPLVALERHSPDITR